MDVVVEQTGCVVQGIAVQMGHADHDLEWMAQGILAKGEIGHIVAERSPDQLLGEKSASWFVVCRSTAARAMDKTYHRDGLHTQHQRVCCHIPRIRQGVLFPQLPKRILSSAHAIIVGDEVAFEETVEGPSWSWSVMPWFNESGRRRHTQDKPQNRQSVSHAQAWLYVADGPQGRAQEDRGRYAGHSEDLDNGRFIGGVSSNISVYWVVGVIRASSRHSR